MFGGLTAEEDAIIDNAISQTYASRDTTPTMADLKIILDSMAGAESLGRRLEKYVTGSYAGFLNNPTNIEIKNKLISKREHIISTAITHHKNGDYISSIPLLLSQIEGVLWDYGVEKNKIKNEFNSRTIIDGNGKEILDENTKKPKQANLQLLLTLVFEGKSKFKEQLRDNVYTPNFRNPILHGREISYADEQRSVWLLLLLFTLIGKTKR